MSHPLTEFAYRKRPAPYIADGHLVMPVRCKTGLAVPRKGFIAHRVAAAAAIFHHGRLQYGARWEHGSGALDVILLASADGLGGTCRRCDEAGLGPAVYRCYNAAGNLLYIGSTANRYDRESQHSSQTPWWPKVTEVRYENHATLVEARIAERRAINAERPAFNRSRASAKAAS